MIRYSIMLCLVHNNNKDRLDAIRPNIELLSSALLKDYHVERVECGYQPMIISHNLWLCIKRDLIYLNLEREWSKYRLIAMPTGIKHVYRLIRLLLKWIGFKKSIRLRKQRSSAIETIVTDKHIRSWDAFLESKCDFLIVVEDDAFFKSDSIDKLMTGVQLAATSVQKDVYLHMDFAGGCSISELKISHLLVGKKKGYIEYKKIVTNTACAYLLNRVIVEQFKSSLTRHPSYRLIGVDWMMNKLLIESDGILPAKCFHSDPPALDHGSVTGVFQAWVR